MKKAILSVLISFFFMADLIACPYCVGSSQSGKDSNTTLILVLFILAIYIPYFILYRMIKKHRAMKEVHDNTGPSNS